MQRAGESEAERQAGRVADLFRQVMRLQRRASPEDWSALSLTMAQMKVLFVLSHHGPSKVTDVAEALGVSAPSITGTLDRLVVRRLVERQAEPSDRRLVIVRLTAEGQTLVEQLHQGRRARLMAALERLDAATVAGLAGGLAALATALESLAEEAAVEARRDGAA